MANPTNSKDKNEPIYLIDGHGYIFRAYYAVRQLATSTGQSTNALFGFCNMLIKVLRERKPKYLAIAFDPGGKNFRHEIYPEYKANRSAPPEDLPPQIPLIQQAVDLFNIHRITQPGVEADDLIGTVAKRYASDGHHVRIITGDKDLYQLVDDRIHIVDDMRAMRGGDGVKKPEVDRETVKEKFGVPPEKVIDVLALAGDTSDNVPGVKGIGVKTAAQLVETYGDLESILAAAPQIKQKARSQRLQDHADDARLSLDLVTIRTNLEVEASLEQLSYSGPDFDKVRAFFEAYELKRLLNDPVLKGASASLVSAPRPTSRRAPQGQQDMFAAAGLAQAPQPIKLAQDAYEAICDKAGLQRIVAELDKAETIGVHVAIDPNPPEADKLVGLGLSWGEGHAAYIPLGHAEELVFPTQLSVDEVSASIGPMLAAQSKTVTIEGAKRAMAVLNAVGFKLSNVEGDTEIASYLLDPEANGHGVVAVSKRRFGHEAVNRETLTGRGKSAKAVGDLEVDKVSAWSCEHAELGRRLHPILSEALDEADMVPLYRDMELPLSATLARVERHGLLIDTARLSVLSQEFETELTRLEQDAWEIAGQSFNLSSPKQVADLLFNQLNLKVVKRTATGPSTDSQVLEQLKFDHALPGLILEHRGVSKLKNTYIDVLPQLVRKETGRVHTRLHQAVAATGRLSSSDPNLQNIPARTELGRKIREAFVAPEGRKILSLDYSQIELRILAHVTRDAVLVEAFEAEQDVHQRTAAEVFDIATDEVSREQRSQAKAINFGLLYGMGVLRLSRELGIKRSEAKAYLDKYHQRLEGVRSWHEESLNRAHQDGFVRTLFGRRRLLPGLQSENRGEVARAERLAINTPIQGSAADMIKRAMIDADLGLQQKVPGAKILLQVHDELLVETDDADVEETMFVVREAMMDAAKVLRVPMVVDGHAGTSWAEVH